MKNTDRLVAECLAIVKEIHHMCAPRCGECKEALTEAEIKERLDNNLKLTDPDVICDDCYADFISQKYDEHRHPDERR